MTQRPGSDRLLHIEAPRGLAVSPWPSGCLPSAVGRRVAIVALLWASAAGIGCGSTPAAPTKPDASARNDGQSPSAGPDGAVPLDPAATAVTLTPPADVVTAVAETRAGLAASAPDGAAAFLAAFEPTYAATLGYDPLQAVNLASVQASASKLNDAELAKLGTNGFVISARQTFPTFFDGYSSIYADHLPVFISADSILYAVHKSYDGILRQVESQLIPAVSQLLASMHATLGAAATPGDPRLAVARKDVDLFLTVARRLLQTSIDAASSPVLPVAGASASEAEALVAKALAHLTDINQTTSLFGGERVIDWSQFLPRGHYAGDPTFEAYFRCMIWLDRTDLRLITTDLTGSHFSRRQFDAALELRLLLDAAGLASWNTVDATLAGFVGESDNMTVRDFDTLRTVLGDATLGDLERHTDQELAQGIVDAKVGIQRIASQVIVVGPLGDNLPLDRAFLFFGQRYVIDSEVLSNVVFDRVLPDPEKRDRRMMPDPLDVAFGALGNTHAAPLLAADLAAHTNYPRALDEARQLVDTHEPAFWTGSLYHAWLASLRAMSPPADLVAATGIPATVARTQPWARRVLNTQLASWAELRHDNLLYAKQSYTSVPGCEFPDAYVDPYPELWAALGRYAAKGMQILAGLPVLAQSEAAAHFTTLGTVAARLQDMATRQIAGQAFTADQLAWVNTVVETKSVSVVCTSVRRPSGWYVDLFLTAEEAAVYAPTIADVHTDPDSARVLHVGTAGPRLMVVTAETCSGPRAYAGLASAYSETITGNFQRLQDSDWEQMLMPTASPPADVRWMTDLVVH